MSVTATASMRSTSCSKSMSCMFTSCLTLQTYLLLLVLLLLERKENELTEYTVKRGNFDNGGNIDNNVPIHILHQILCKNRSYKMISVLDLLQAVLKLLGINFNMIKK